MKNIVTAIILSSLILTLVSCSTFSPQPTETPTPTQTNLLTLTNTSEPTFTSTPIEIIKTNTPTVLPTSTLDISPAVTVTPTQQNIPLVALNLLQNGGFEDDLTGWTFANEKELFTYETTGISGKGICSRQYVPNVWATSELFSNELVSFSQEVNTDPLIQSYFLSAWVKLNKAINIYIKIEYYDGSKSNGGVFVELSKHNQSNRQNNGRTTDGWYFIHYVLPVYEPHINKVVISFIHGSIKDPPQNVDSTFCLDDIIFGGVAK